MDLKEIKQFFEDNKDQEDVKNYLQELSKVTADGVESFLETDEGKKILQPKLDSHFTKGLETWKQNNLQKLVDEKVKELYPEEDPRDKDLKKLQQQVKQMEQEKQHESLKNKALSVASEKKLPTQLVDFMIGEDEEQTNSNLSKLEEVWNSQIQSVVDEKLKSNGTNPGKGNPPKTFTKEQITNMSPDEINKNWDAISGNL